MKTTHIGLLAAGILLVGITVWGIRSRLAVESAPSIAPTPSATTTEQGKLRVDAPNIQYGFETPKGRVTTTALSKELPVPDLNRPITIPQHHSDIAASITGEINRIVVALKENPTNAALWGTLGLKRKGIEDYEGARQAYEYSLALAPDNGVTAENLGVLYGYYLHEPKKAEKYFLQALDIEPEMAHRYLRLYELYKDIFNDTAKARAILEQGLEKHPGNPSFKALLEQL